MWALILHGGAKEIPADKAGAHRAGCLRALGAGRHALIGGGSALDAVEAAIRELESDPIFNAGFGSALNIEGEVEMCSAIMEGSHFDIGGVIVIKGVNHPISVARTLLLEDEILLAGDDAWAFAFERGCETCETVDLIPAGQKPRAKGTHDTVGCVALDEDGVLAVGTSTGGLEGAPAGRVGDAPQPGCGYYADSKIGGVTFSGDGEQIARKMLAARVMQKLAADSPEAALLAALWEAEDIGGEAGGIVLTPDGRFGWEHTSRDFAVAYQSSGMDSPAVFTSRKVAQL
ncbi:MAG: isoaspartyl peptidase/L-asparaginase family protein [Hyphomonas sp.]